MTSEQIPSLTFDDGAQALFLEWYSILENRLRSGEIESQAFEAHLAKFRSLMPSLALIFHLINFADGRTSETRVSLDAARKAADWCDFLEEHAKKVYKIALNRDVQKAHLLAAKIRSGDIQDGTEIRAIYRRGWSQLAKPDDVYSGLAVLEKYGWVRCESEFTGGRNREVVRLHLELRKEVKE